MNAPRRTAREDLRTRSALRLCLALALLPAITGCDLVRVIFPSSHHDETAPELPTGIARPSILVFHKTNGFRHEEAIVAGVPALEAIARQRGFGFFSTENGAIHDAEKLADFDVIVWFQTSGDVLSADQRQALRAWIEAGGSFLGVHGTGGDPSYDWAWQPETLVGAQFIGHPMNPQFQEATIRVEATDHPVMRGLPATWVRTEEWYSFEQSPRGAGVQILATLDESTYAPRFELFFIDRDLRMGADHPIVWTHCIGRGHVIYSALGHQGVAYTEERAHLRLLENALDWLVGAKSSACRVS